MMSSNAAPAIAFWSPACSLRWPWWRVCVGDAVSELFDVVIYDMESRKIESIIGKGMKRFGDHNSAERRLDTAYQRINVDRYGAEIVETGTLKVGDVLP